MRTLWIVTYAVSLAACSGGGGGREDRSDVAPTGSIGYLKGPSIAGLRYQPADAAPTIGGLPITDAAGRYELSSANVRFFLGRLELGTATAGGVLNWLMLGRSSQELTNIFTLLSVADADGDVRNGISIPEAITERAMHWELNFASETFAEDLAAVVLPDIQSVYGRVPVVPTAQAVADFHAQSFHCSYSGMYVGHWNQTSLPQDFYALDPALQRALAPAGGNLLMLITTPSGHVVGHQTFLNSVAVFVDQNGLPVQRRPSFYWQGNPTAYSGVFSTLQEMNGHFSAALVDPTGKTQVYAGNMNAERVVGAAAAVRRFAVNFTNNSTHYLLHVDIDANQQASGAVIVDGAGPVRLSGELQGQQIHLSSASEYRVDGEVASDLLVLTMTLTDHLRGTTQSFTGSNAIVGCPT